VDTCFEGRVRDARFIEVIGLPFGLSSFLYQCENGGSASKVLPSLFLSPGGTKFTSLMLHLASHVMLQEMNAFATGMILFVYLFSSAVPGRLMGFQIH